MLNRDTTRHWLRALPVSIVGSRSCSRISFLTILFILLIGLGALYDSEKGIVGHVPRIRGVHEQSRDQAQHVVASLPDTEEKRKIPHLSLCTERGGCQGDVISGVMYNRVPKCASRTVYYTLLAMRKQNNFTMHNVKPFNPSRRFPEDKWDEFRENVTKFQVPFVYAQHFLFFEFNDSYPVLPYINVVRDPVERAVSAHYFNQNGSVESRKRRKKHSIVTLEECIEKRGVAACTHDNGSPLRFLCGHDVICGTVNADSLKLAMRNAERYYLLVGLVEDLPAFFSVLEYLLPSFFTGIEETYKNIGSERHQDSKTYKKRALAEDTKVLLERHLEPEYSLYSFIKARFYSQLMTIQSKVGKT